MEYYEFNVINPENQGKKGTIFNFLKKASLVVLGIACLLILVTLDFEQVTGENAGMAIFYNVLIILMSTLPPLGLFFIFRRLAAKYCDYDYFIMGDTLRIVKIINKTNRKCVDEFSFHDIEEIGLISSPSFEKANEKIEKKFDYTCDRYTDNVLYIVKVFEGERSLILCQYDDNFMTALHKSMKRESVFDKSVYKSKT